MQTFHAGQQVTYVAPIDRVGGKPTNKKAVVIEVLAPTTVRLDYTPRNDKGEAADPDKAPLGHHTAIAELDDSDSPKENTFHVTSRDEKVAPVIPPTTTAPASARA